MLYLGHFNYRDANDPEENFVLLPVVVRAEDPEEALAKMATHFEDVRETSDLLDGANEIFLDSLIELEEAPDDAVLVQWTKVVPTAKGLTLVNDVLPLSGVEEGEPEAYGYVWADEDAADDDLADDEDAFYDDEPFIEFSEE